MHVAQSQLDLDHFRTSLQCATRAHATAMRNAWMIKHPLGRGTPGEHGRQYDFEAWLYHVPYPPCAESAFPTLRACAEDIRFAFNAYNLIRACLYFGMPRPTLLKRAASCTPSLDIAMRGNRLFHSNCYIDTPLLPPIVAPLLLSPAATSVMTTSSGVREGLERNESSAPLRRQPAVRVGLTPHPTKAMAIDDVDWRSLANAERHLRLRQRQQQQQHGNSGACGVERGDEALRVDEPSWLDIARGSSSASLPRLGDDDANIGAASPSSPALATPIQLVVGMENGMSSAVADECDLCVHIAQFGSIGSLSMVSALAVALHSVHTGLRGRGRCPPFTATTSSCRRSSARTAPTPSPPPSRGRRSSSRRARATRTRASARRTVRTSSAAATRR